MGLSREMPNTQKPRSTWQTTVICHNSLCCLKVEPPHRLAHQPRPGLIRLMGV